MTFEDRSGPSDAHLDPWCATPVDGGKTLPFDFSLRHPRTGGLGWLVRTEVEEPDFDAGRAGTRSGRRYRLGRRFDAVDFGFEGDEAGTAFRYLLESDFDGFGAFLALDKLWLVSRKVSRHLGLQHPPRRSADVRTFRVAPSSVPRGGHHEEISVAQPSQVRMLVSNCARCGACGTVVVSRHTHDFVWCPCGKLAVDGGLTYVRRLSSVDYEELSRWRDADGKLHEDDGTWNPWPEA